MSEEVLSDLSVLKEDLVKEIAKHFHAKDGSFFIDAGHVEKNIDPFTHDLEQRFEATVEKIVEQSIGAILMQIGKEIVSSEGDMTAFGQRMEKMGENIEHAVEKMAENVEGKMDSLCGKIEKLDHLENALYKEVPEFEGHDLINLKRS